MQPWVSDFDIFKLRTSAWFNFYSGMMLVISPERKTPHIIKLSVCSGRRSSHGFFKVQLNGSKLLYFCDIFNVFRRSVIVCDHLGFMNYVVYTGACNVRNVCI